MAVTNTFDPAIAVNVGTNRITIPTHGFIPDKGVIYSSGGGSSVGGLVDGYKYYIIWIDINTFKLALTEDDARAGTAIDLLSTGSGSFHALTTSNIFPNSAAYYDFFRRIRLLGTGLPIEGETIVADNVRDSLTIIGGNNITLTDVNDVQNTFTINAPSYDITVPVATTNIRLQSDLTLQDIILTPVRGIAITRIGPQEVGFESFGVTETDTLHTVTSRGNITNNDLVINNLLISKVVSQIGEDGFSSYSIGHTAGGVLSLTGNGTLDAPLLLSPDESQATDASDTITILFNTPSAGQLSYTAVYKTSAVLTAGSVTIERKDIGSGLWIPLDLASGTTERTSYQISNTYSELNSGTTEYRVRISWSGNFEYVNYRIRLTFEANLVAGNELIRTDTDTNDIIFGAIGGTSEFRGIETHYGVATFRDKIYTTGLRIFENNIEGLNSNDDIFIDPHGTGAVVLKTSDLVTDQTTFNLINTVAETINFGGSALTVNFGSSATSFNFGSPTGTFTFANPTLTGTNATVFNMNGASPSIVTTSTGTVSVFNTNALTGNLFGAATAVSIGATTGTLTLNNPTIVGQATTQNLFNTVATTLNIGGAATTIGIGASGGTVTVAGDLVVNGTTTTINSTTLTVDDKNIELGSIASPTDITADGGGITLKAAADKTITWVRTSNRWTSNVGFEATVIDNTPIGSNVRAAGAFTTLQSNDATTLGDTSADTLTVNATVTSNLIFTDATYDIGASGATRPRSLFLSNNITTGGNATFGTDNTNTVTVNSYFVASTQLRTAKLDTNKLYLSAYDVDGLAYSNLITLTAGNDPKLDLTSTAVGTINNMSIGDTTRGTGKFTTLDANQTVTFSPDGFNVTISPTNAGTVTINPNTAGTINKMSIGVTTAAAGRFTTLKVKDTGAAFDLSIVPTSSTTATADRSLTVDVINADRTVKLAGNLDFANNFTTSGAAALTLTLNSASATNATFPATGNITLAYQGGTLGQFAATTSLQLAGVISDETGSGALVFGTAPTIAGGSITGLTTFAIRDTSAAFDVTLAATSSTTLTAGRTLTVDVVNAARTLKLGANVDVSGALTLSTALTVQTGAVTLTAQSGGSSVTLPTSGTLATTGNLSQFAATTSAQLAGVISDETGSGALVFGTAPTVSGIVQGSASSTTDADATVDASTTTYYSWIQSASATARTISVSNLTAGRAVWIYLRNTNGSTKTITIQASATTTGFTGINFAVGSTRGAASATTVTLAATSGTAMVMVMNANGSFVGGMM